MKANNETEVRAGKDCCVFCGQWVDLANEGVTFSSGGCAHESCNDGNEFNKANESDFRD